MNDASAVGRYDDMPIGLYHKTAGWSKSRLDLVAKSYSHYLAAEAEPREQTPALLMGSAIHCAILTSRTFKAEYAVSPKFDRRTKEGKEDSAKFDAENSDKTILTVDQAGIVAAVVESFDKHPTARKILGGGDAEQSFFWIDQKTKILCKTRPDYLRSDGVAVELKTTEDAGWFSFQRDIVKYRYHVQGAMIVDGVHASCGIIVKDFVIVALEKTPPYAIACYRMDADALEVGRTAYKNNLETVKEHEGNPTMWHGYPEHIQDIFLPAWVV